MKKLISIFLLCFIAHHSTSQAKTKDNAVLVNVGAMPFGIYEAAFERALDKDTSISFAATYYDTRKVLLTRIFSYGYMIGLGVAPKFHLYGKALHNSFFLSPSLNIGYLDHPKAKESERRSVLLRIGASFGYAKVFTNGLALSFSAGLERYHNFYLSKPATDLQTERDTGGMFRPVMSASIGYAF